MRDYALQYASRGWPIFRLSRTKKPLKGSHGFKDATTDLETIDAWWRETPWANIGLATGKIVVLDADGAGGLRALRELNASVGVPPTLLSQTSRGCHVFLQAPDGVEIRTRNAKRAKGEKDGLDIKGHGGYVVLPPSINAVTGFQYKFLNDSSIAGMAPELAAWCQQGTRPESQALAIFGGAVPAFLSGYRARGLVERLAWSAHDEARIRAALGALAADDYDTWLAVGMALHWLRWERSDGTNIGFELWDAWSQSCGDKYALAAVEAKWESFERSARAGVSVGTLFHLAQEAGWGGEVAGTSHMPAAPESRIPHNATNLPDPGGHVNGTAAVNGAGIWPAVAVGAGIVFPDTDKAGNPKATAANAAEALRGLAISCCHDTFHERLLLGGRAIEQWAGELSDHAVLMLRVAIKQQFGFDPGAVHTHDAAVQECLQHPYDPVVRYLDACTWDGWPRIEGWLANYLGAADTPLHREMGKLVLAAAVRRARVPGTKYDTIMVLEGPEGTRKSSAVSLLAGEDNFSDQLILTLDERAQQEALQGIWIYEVADMAGMSRADIDKVKTFASRQRDRARPAYGRARVDRPRRCIFIATTNNETYLKSQTGNRRFWPVKTGRITLEELARDRDQLWAEAVQFEKSGVPLALPQRFWADAAIAQDARRDHDPWDDILSSMTFNTAYPTPDGRGQEFRATTQNICCGVLGLTNIQVTDAVAKRISYSMRRLGWDGPKAIWLDGKTFRGYSKPVL